MVSIETTETIGTEAPDLLGQRVELDVSGMTCAACANRIERKLNKLDGVRATVNYATERAVVMGVPAERSPELVQFLRKTARPHRPRPAVNDQFPAHRSALAGHSGGFQLTLFMNDINLISD